MKFRGVGLLLCVAVMLVSSSACSFRDSQTKEPVSTRQSSANAKPAIDRSHFLKFSGALKNHEGKRLTGTVGVLFSIYEQKEGGAPLWQEVQNVDLNERGHFEVLVGSTTNEGIPAEFFAAGKPRWFGVQVLMPGETEQKRIRLVSGPNGLHATRLLLPDQATGPTATATATQTSGEAPPTQQDQNQQPRRPRRFKGQLQQPPTP